MTMIRNMNPKTITINLKVNTNVILKEPMNMIKASKEAMNVIKTTIKAMNMIKVTIKAMNMIKMKVRRLTMISPEHFLKKSLWGRRTASWMWRNRLVNILDRTFPFFLATLTCSLSTEREQIIDS